MMQRIFLLAVALWCVASSADAAGNSTSKAKSSSNGSAGGDLTSSSSSGVGTGKLDIGEGHTIKSKSKKTVFYGTEYDPAKCVLQFDSIGCKNDKSCADLNGYKLQCQKVGVENGEPKMKCVCEQKVKGVCQNSTAPTLEGAYQFDDCTNKKCVAGYGHVPSTTEQRTCAERLQCVKEIDTKATAPAQICHTCRSCIAQNDKAKVLTAEKRFDCTSICPKEILDSIAERNKKGKGIADELNTSSSSSGSSSTSSTSSTSSSSQATSSSNKSGGSKDKSTKDKDTKKSAATSVVSVSAFALLSVLCSMALSM